MQIYWLNKMLFSNMLSYRVKLMILIIVRTAVFILCLPIIFSENSSPHNYKNFVFLKNQKYLKFEN